MNVAIDAPWSNTPLAASPHSAVQSILKSLRSPAVLVPSSQSTGSSFLASSPAYSPSGDQYTSLTFPSFAASTAVPFPPAPQLASGQAPITDVPAGWTYVVEQQTLQLQERTRQLELQERTRQLELQVNLKQLDLQVEAKRLKHKLEVWHDMCHSGDSVAQNVLAKRLLSDDFSTTLVQASSTATSSPLSLPYGSSLASRFPSTGELGTKAPIAPPSSHSNPSLSSLHLDRFFDLLSNPTNVPAGGSQSYSGSFVVNGGTDAASFTKVPGGYDSANIHVLDNPDCRAFAKSAGGHVHARDGYGNGAGGCVPNIKGNATNSYGPTADGYGNRAGGYVPAANMNGMDRYGNATNTYSNIPNAYSNTTNAYGNTAGAYSNTTNVYRNATNAHGNATDMYSNIPNAYGNMTNAYNVAEGYAPAMDMNRNAMDAYGNKAGGHIQAMDMDGNAAAAFADANTHVADIYASTPDANTM